MDTKPQTLTECACGKLVRINRLEKHQKTAQHYKYLEEKGTYKELRRIIKSYLKDGKGAEIRGLIEQFEKGKI